MEFSGIGIDQMELTPCLAPGKPFNSSSDMGDNLLQLAWSS